MFFHTDLHDIRKFVFHSLIDKLVFDRINLVDDVDSRCIRYLKVMQYLPGRLVAGKRIGMAGIDHMDEYIGQR